MTVLGALARQPQNAIQVTPWGDWSGTSGQTWAGVNVDTNSALQLLTVYGCDRYICDGISTFPTDVLKRDARGGPVAQATPEIISRPSMDLEFIPWATQFLSSLLLAGNFYGYRVYSGGKLREVIPLDPARVTVRRDAGRKVYDVGGRTYTSLEILHVPGVMLPGSDVGLAPIEAARQMIGAGLAAEEFTGRFWGEGAAQGGVIEVPAEKTPDEAKAMARAWDKTHGGSSKAHKTGVLVGGAAWKQTQVTNEQAQFLETRQFTASQIASMMFQIDPSEMGLPVEGSSLTYANLEQRNIRKVQVTFLPWIIRLEAALTSMIPGQGYVKLNVNGLLRGDTQSRFAAYGVGIDKKFLLPNEARDFEDWAPLEGGDEFAAPPAPAPAFVPAAAPAALQAAAPVGVRAALEVMQQMATESDAVMARMAAESDASDDELRRVVSEFSDTLRAMAEREPPVFAVSVQPADVVVQAAETPVVNVTVEAPSVQVTNDVQPAGVTVIDPPKSRRVVRDPVSGNIVQVVEE